MTKKQMQTPQQQKREASDGKHAIRREQQRRDKWLKNKTRPQNNAVMTEVIDSDNMICDRRRTPRTSSADRRRDWSV